MQDEIITKIKILEKSIAVRENMIRRYTNDMHKQISKELLDADINKLDKYRKEYPEFFI